MLFKGYAAGAIHYKGGSGSNFLCLPEDPQWKTYRDGDQNSGSIAGVEYELVSVNNVFSVVNNGGNPLGNKQAPCVVCYVSGRSAILMIPARTQCPDGWTSEYVGYLVSEHALSSSTNPRHRSNYVCWDEAPEVTAVNVTNQNQAVIYTVEVQCGSLPCSDYISGRELTCVVCSK